MAVVSYLPERYRLAWPMVADGARDGPFDWALLPVNGMAAKPSGWPRCSRSRLIRPPACTTPRNSIPFTTEPSTIHRPTLSSRICYTLRTARHRSSPSSIEDGSRSVWPGQAISCPEVSGGASHENPSKYRMRLVTPSFPATGVLLDYSTGPRFHVLRITLDRLAWQAVAHS
jgi:hypothetical protein